MLEENISIYWLSGKDTAGNAKAIKQGRPRSLRRVDDFFLTLCRMRQGFSELYLLHLFNIAWINFIYFLDKLYVFETWSYKYMAF